MASRTRSECAQAPIDALRPTRARRIRALLPTTEARITPMTREWHLRSMERAEAFEAKHGDLIVGRPPPATPTIPATEMLATLAEYGRQRAKVDRRTADTAEFRRAEDAVCALADRIVAAHGDSTGRAQ